MHNKSWPSQKTHSLQWLEYPRSLCFLSLREKSTKQNLFSHLVLFIPGSVFHASLTPSLSLSLSRSVFITTSPKKCTPWSCGWLLDGDTDMLAPGSARTTWQEVLGGRGLSWGQVVPGWPADMGLSIKQIKGRDSRGHSPACCVHGRLPRRGICAC